MVKEYQIIFSFLSLETGWMGKKKKKKDFCEPTTGRHKLRADTMFARVIHQFQMYDRWG